VYEPTSVFPTRAFSNVGSRWRSGAVPGRSPRGKDLREPGVQRQRALPRVAARVGVPGKSEADQRIALVVQVCAVERTQQWRREHPEKVAEINAARRVRTSPAACADCGRGLKASRRAQVRCVDCQDAHRKTRSRRRALPAASRCPRGSRPAGTQRSVRCATAARLLAHTDGVEAGIGEPRLGSEAYLRARACSIRAEAARLLQRIGLAQRQRRSCRNVLAPDAIALAETILQCLRLAGESRSHSR
jgi:hypothetical protein